jgi:CheY-like chemotaxis protein
VTNLLINAVKHGYKDRDVIVLIQRYRNDRWTIRVINEGPGIPRERLEAIFLPYTTSASGQGKGSGLGLYIVKTKAWVMGGMVDVESVQDGYTTFTVTLPLVEGKAMNLPLKPSRTALKELPGNLHIILVEDNHLNAKGMVYLLEEFGCSVTVLRSGTELLKRLENVLPDIIMLDYYLPGMLGSVIIEKIRSIPATRHIPIIAATGGIHGGEIQEMLSAGADTFFKKDVDIDGLRLALQQCTKKKQINYSKE